MPNKEIEKNDETEKVRPPRRRVLTRRRVSFGFGGIAIFLLLVFVVVVVLYKFAVFDGYVRDRFTAKMSDIGITFNADAFRLVATPFELHLKNATFNDKITGERLFFISEANLGMTILDLFSLQTTRDVSS